MFTIDGHSDTILWVKNDPDYNFFRENKRSHMDLPRMKKGKVNLQIMAMFIESQYKPYQSTARTFELCGCFHRLLREGKDQLVFVKDVADIEYLEKNRDLVGLMMALEGGEAITNVDILHCLYALGLRLVTLTWNQRNLLADGVGESATGGGLTKLGKEIVREMNKLGMVVDVSHLSERGFWDVVGTCEGPFVASHSNAYGLTPHPRNLKDDQITALVKKGGILGINFATSFLTDKARASLQDVLAHIEYITSRWGFDCVALGTDYDGIHPTPEGLEDVSCLPNLTEALLARYKPENVEKIMGGNWKRVLVEIFAKGG